MPLGLLDLPSELITDILAFLDCRSILVCQSCCRLLNSIIQGSASLQYLIECYEAGVDDELRPGLPFSERLELLRQRESSWFSIEPRRSVHIPVPFQSSGIYDLTGGAYVLGTRLYQNDQRRTDGYSYVRLPSLADAVSAGENDPSAQWFHTKEGEEVIDFGLAILEHDLCAILTVADAESNEHSNSAEAAYHLHFLSFSTGRHHPSAVHPIVFVVNKRRTLGPVSIVIEIVGDLLGLMISFPWARGWNCNSFHLVEWKKGNVYELRISSFGACAYFSFLAEDVLVLPDMLDQSLELAKIVLSSDTGIPSLQTLCNLALPKLRDSASIFRLSSRAEPNPIGRNTSAISVPARRGRPFRDTPEDAIILFHLLVHVADIDGMNLHPLSCIIHRRKLLSFVPSEELRMPFQTAQIAEPARLAYEEWGKKSARWFESDSVATRWITTASGQRYVFLVSVLHGDTIEERIRVCDFNPHSIRRARARIGEGQIFYTPSGNEVKIVDEPSFLDTLDIFEEDVESGLEYVQSTMKGKLTDYDGVLMDEERILCLRLGGLDHTSVEAIDVLIFG